MPLNLVRILCPTVKLGLGFAEDTTRALWYGAALFAQLVFARWLARVQGEQLVMSVIACKASSSGR